MSISQIWCKELTHGRFAAISESGDASLPDGEGGPRVSKAALHAAKKQFEEVTKSLVDILVRLEERRSNPGTFTALVGWS